MRPYLLPLNLSYRLSERIVSSLDTTPILPVPIEDRVPLCLQLNLTPREGQQDPGRYPADMPSHAHREMDTGGERVLG